MSRLIVKNLPPYVTPALLKEHFSQSKGPGGTITDVKVALKQDGTARRFGFVGFKTDEDALKAKEWYDKTFIDSTRVRVEVIDGANGVPAPRPNKRPRLDTSPTQRDTGSTSNKSRTHSRKSDAPSAKVKGNDASFEEFMEVMLPKAKRIAPGMDRPVASPLKKCKMPVTHGESENPQETVDQQGLTDMEWMRQRMTGVEDPTSSEKPFEQSDSEDQAEKVPDNEDPTVKTILHTARLFIRNLTFTCNEDELRGLFQPFGAVSQVCQRSSFTSALLIEKLSMVNAFSIGTADPSWNVDYAGKLKIIHIPVDSVTKESKGLAFVTYTQSLDALVAFRALDKKPFQGRLLHIIGAVDKRDGAATTEGTGKSKTLKEQRNEKRKAAAGKGFNWSMLYMNSDAVLSSVADRMNISKSDILDPEVSDAAVKLALAETHIIQETKTHLESHGVVLSAFSGRGRSETVILVKNIPYGTTAEQLREIFGAHGELQRVLVPPAGTLAVIEFVHADDAHRAFRAVSYRRLGNSVIYLEKGPLGMFQSTSSVPEIASDVAPVTIGDTDVGEDADVDTTGGKTLFVKNLAFATPTERFTTAFRHLPGFAFARVQTKPDSKRPGARLSMGFGFVGFRTADAARRALKGMHGFVLDGHTLSVKFAGRGAEEQDEVKQGGREKANTTKMLVKNVPFEVTRKDIQELFGQLELRFSAYGKLKSVRLPKRFDRRSRGFAFLEFVTRHEAENAYNALKHTHLLGRHLVLEWAQEGDVNIDELRKKAGVGFGNGADMPGKKRKLVLDEDDDGREDEV
ncbi:hypothetical protein EDB89DRAFT_1903300 [Lactarius sanguifluus]|nr:hypothetical protein EDB89DRAFT_1903300 [Lactarius sanguifluus]